jgi:hypothetical protein
MARRGLDIATVRKYHPEYVMAGRRWDVRDYQDRSGNPST